MGSGGEPAVFFGGIGAGVISMSRADELSQLHDGGESGYDFIRPRIAQALSAWGTFSVAPQAGRRFSDSEVDLAVLGPFRNCPDSERFEASYYEAM
jgi:hypothetical protein